MKTTQLNLRTLAAVNLVASKEEARYSLNGVLVECRDSTVTYVATDGVRMLVAQHDLPELAEGAEGRLTGDFIIPSNVCSLKKLSGQPYLSHDVDTLTLQAYGRLALQDAGRVFAPIDGTFPDWRLVCPGPQDISNLGIGNIAQFNTRYLHDFNRFAVALGAGENAPCIEFTDCKAPHAVTFGSLETPRAFGVLMPVRKSPSGWSGSPDWTRVAAPLAMAAE